MRLRRTAESLHGMSDSGHRLFPGLDLFGLARPVAREELQAMGRAAMGLPQKAGREAGPELPPWRRISADAVGRAGLQRLCRAMHRAAAERTSVPGASGAVSIGGAASGGEGAVATDEVAI